MKQVLKIILYCILSLLLSNCISRDNNNRNMPQPKLSSIYPPTKVSRAPTFTLTAIGTGFLLDSKIVFNGVEKETTFVSTTQLTCEINPEDTVIEGASIRQSESENLTSTNNLPVLVRNPSPSNGDSNTIYFEVKSTMTFDTKTIISSSIGKFFGPRLVIDNSEFFYLIYGYTAEETGTISINFIRSTDYGKIWTVPIIITQYTLKIPEWDYSNPHAEFNPGIAVDSEGNINVVYTTGSTGYFTRSTDNGNTWSIPVIISNQDMILILTPSIAIGADGGLNVAWPHENNDYHFVNFTQSQDNGETWSEPIYIINREEADNSLTHFDASIYADKNGGIYITGTSWFHYPRYEYDHVYLVFSHDNGVTWDYSYENFSELDKFTVFNRDPDMTIVKDGMINIVYSQSFSRRQQDVYFIKSTDFGKSWNEAIKINNTGFSITSTNPGIAVDIAGNINVVYNHNNNTLFTRSIDNGATWTDSTPIYANLTEIRVDNAGNIYSIWVDKSQAIVYFTSGR